MKINEISKITGVSTKTLQYYDKIGLLKPNKLENSNHRIYNEQSLKDLQQILFFKELDFSLTDIKKIICSEHYNKDQALRKQKELLIKKKKYLTGLIDLIDKAIKGKDSLSFKEFDISDIEQTREQYGIEVEKDYLHTSALKQSIEKIASSSEEELREAGDQTENLLKAFSQNKDTDPSFEVAQQLVQKWQENITTNFYECSLEILEGLGQIYLEDDNFRNSIDNNGVGTTKFLSEAIAIYCKNNKN